MSEQQRPKCPGTVIVDASIARRIAALGKREGGLHKIAPRLGAGAEALRNIVAGRPVRSQTALVVAALLEHAEQTIALDSVQAAARLEHALGVKRFVA